MDDYNPDTVAISETWLSSDIPSHESFHKGYHTYVTGFGKTDHIVTIAISRNTELKYRSRHGYLVLDCSHARFAV